MAAVVTPTAPVPTATPDASVPDASVPDASVPDASVPDASVPAASVPQVPEPETGAAESAPVETPYEPPPGLPATPSTSDDDGASKRPSPLILALAALVIAALVGGAGFALTRGRKESAVPSESTPSMQTPSSASTSAAAIALYEAELTSAVAGSYDPVLSTITVDTNGAEVRLAGHAYDSATKAGVLKAARRVAGVADAKDDMILLGHGQTCTEVMRSKTTWAASKTSPGTAS